MRKIVVCLAVAGVILAAAPTAGAQQSQQPQQQAAPATQGAPPPSGGAGNFGSNAPAANPFPDHPGREIVAVSCTQCHGPNVFTSSA